MISSRPVAVMSVLSLLVVVLVAGCLSYSGTRDTTPIGEAEQRVEDYSRQALAVLPAHARTEVDLMATSGCHDDFFGTKGQETTLRNQIHDLLPNEYPEYFDRLESWWLDHDFRVQDDERPTRESISVNNAERFWMEILHEDGELVLITTSPCVWPNGTPEPA